MNKLKTNVLMNMPEYYNRLGVFLTDSDTGKDILEECGFGYEREAVLKSKANFYTGASEYSALIKYLCASFNAYTMYFGTFEKHIRFFRKYKNGNRFDCVYALEKDIKRLSAYSFDIHDFPVILDDILENGFRYFSEIALYIPKINIAIQPDAHGYIQVYGTDALLMRIAYLTKQFNKRFDAILFDKNNGRRMQL